MKKTILGIQGTPFVNRIFKDILGKIHEWKMKNPLKSHHLFCSVHRVYGIQNFSQEEISCGRKIFRTVVGNNLSQEKFSVTKRYFFWREKFQITETHFLSKKENSCPEIHIWQNNKICVIGSNFLTKIFFLIIKPKMTKSCITSPVVSFQNSQANFRWWKIISGSEKYHPTLNWTCIFAIKSQWKKIGTFFVS